MGQRQRGRPPKREEDRYQRVGVTFRPDHVQFLDRMAARQGMSISEVLREILDLLQQHEEE